MRRWDVYDPSDLESSPRYYTKVSPSKEKRFGNPVWRYSPVLALIVARMLGFWSGQRSVRCSVSLFLFLIVVILSSIIGHGVLTNCRYSDTAVSPLHTGVLAAGSSTRRSSVAVFPQAETSTHRPAIVTLMTDDSYLLGVLVLFESIRTHGFSTTANSETHSDNVPLLVMVTPKVVTARPVLRRYGATIVPVEPVSAPSSVLLPGFQRYRDTYTKLRLWGLADFSPLLFLDADTLVLRNIEHLLDIFRSTAFDNAAARCSSSWTTADVGTGPGLSLIAAAADCCDKFNPGVVVTRPNPRLLATWLKMLDKTPSYDGGDGGFLNSWFGGLYNSQCNAGRLLVPLNSTDNADQNVLMLPRNRNAMPLETVRIVHFAGPKPWDRLPKARDVEDASQQKAAAERLEESKKTSPAALHDVLPLHRAWRRVCKNLLQRLPASDVAQMGLEPSSCDEKSDE